MESAKKVVTQRGGSKGRSEIFHLGGKERQKGLAIGARASALHRVKGAHRRGTRMYVCRNDAADVLPVMMLSSMTR